MDFSLILLIYWMSVYAISYVIVEDDLLDNIKHKFTGYMSFSVFLFRFFDKVFQCIFCCSFWIGLILGIPLFGLWGILTAFSCFTFTKIIYKNTEIQ